jgi:hypothetical protein
MEAQRCRGRDACVGCDRSAAVGYHRRGPFTFRRYRRRSPNNSAHHRDDTAATSQQRRPGAAATFHARRTACDARSHRCTAGQLTGHRAVTGGAEPTAAARLKTPRHSLIDSVDISRCAQQRPPDHTSTLPAGNHRLPRAAGHQRLTPRTRRGLAGERS